MGELTGWLGTSPDSGASLTSFLSTLISSFTLVAGIVLFSCKLNRKKGYWPRLLALSGSGVAIYALGASCVYFLDIPFSAAASYITLFLVFSFILFALSGAELVLRNGTIWSAFFCVTSGYALQNLTSGTMELTARVLRETGVDPTNLYIYILINFIPICIVLVTAWRLLAKRIGPDDLAQIKDHSLAFMMPTVCVCIIGFDVMIKAMDGAGLALPFSILLRVFHGLACVATLWVEYQMLFRSRLEHEQAVTERLLAEHDRQLRLSRENIDAINVKCHDLRHQIRSLGESGAVVSGDALADLAREVRFYDSSVKTGNEALDTILTEKRLVCEGHGITLTCIADGSALAMMAPADIYSLFGNALDNAIEAVGELADPARRTITLSVRRTMGCASIHVENFFDGERRLSEDGLPLTTKKDRLNHGFGTRSMQAVAQRYNGTFSAVADAGTFRLDVMLPLE